MKLTEPQRDALLTLANTTSGHDFVPQEVLEDLLSMELVFWRSPDEMNLTPAGEKVYQALAAALSGDELAVSFPGSP
jgi:hypothetical protein